MQTPSIDFTGTDKMSVFAGVRKLSGAGRIIVELSSDLNANNGTFNLQANGAVAGRSRTVSKGTVNSGNVDDPTVIGSPASLVLTGIGDISGDNATLRVNGAQVAQSTDNQGTGDYGNYPLFIGSRGGTSLFLDGHIHSLIVRGALTDTPTIERTERYVASKTAGVSIP
jgi:hypothetical protein